MTLPVGSGGEPAVPRGVRRPLRHRAADLRRRAGRARPRAPRRDSRGERGPGLHGGARAARPRGRAPARHRDRADDRRRGRAPRQGRHRRLRRLAGLSQDDAGGDARVRGAGHRRAPLPPRGGLRRTRALARRPCRAPGPAGVPPGGAGHRARDGAPALSAVGRGRGQGGRDGTRGAEPRHAAGACGAQDRSARARAGRRAEHPDAGRRRTRRSAGAPGRAGARRRARGPGDAGARARRVWRRGGGRRERDG